MTGVEILFFFFMALAGGSALAIILSNNVFKSALFLLITLLSVAALYVLSFAEFLAVAQILVYAGGILVVIIFGIMLTTRISGQPMVVKNTHIFSGTIAGAGLFAVLAANLPALRFPAGEGLMPENINVIGLKLFSEYLLPFEIAGILLLIALIGAAVITAPLKSRE